MTSIEDLITKIKELGEEREMLLQSDLAPEGAWIHKYEIHRSYPSGHSATYTYAKWQADKAIFRRNPKKNARVVRKDKDKNYTRHQHIGNVETNPEVEAAYQALANRRRLEEIEQALGEIEVIIFKVLENIDEAQDIFSGSKQLREACEDMLDSNMRKGRSLNIAFWYGLQKFSALPESITINLNSRIVMTHKQTGEVLNALPGVSKETLSLVTELKPGEALVSLFGSNSIVKAKMHPSKALLTKE